MFKLYIVHQLLYMCSSLIISDVIVGVIGVLAWYYYSLFIGAAIHSIRFNSITVVTYSDAHSVENSKSETKILNM